MQLANQKLKQLKLTLELEEEKEEEKRKSDLKKKVGFPLFSTPVPPRARCSVRFGSDWVGARRTQEPRLTSWAGPADIQPRDGLGGWLAVPRVRWPVSDLGNRSNELKF